MYQESCDPLRGGGGGGGGGGGRFIQEEEESFVDNQQSFVDNQQVTERASDFGYTQSGTYAYV